MLQIKSVIKKLKEPEYRVLDQKLQEAKAEKFRTLLTRYRVSSLSDNEIQEELNISSNAFYVLKSRLYEKIQEQLLDQSVGPKTDILRKIITIPKLLYDSPPDISIAILCKLEKDLIGNDMPQELTSVYGALRKLHLHTDKYYEYSQKYNKHVAFTLALDKAEGMLTDFSKHLGDYHASRDPQILEYFTILKKEMASLVRLYDSHHLKVAQHIMNVSIALFLPLEEEVANDEPVEDALRELEQILGSYPADGKYQYLQSALNFLFFEYYHKLGLSKKAGQYFELVNTSLPSFLFFNHLTYCSRFLISKIERYIELDMTVNLQEECKVNLADYEPEKNDIPNYVNYVIFRAASAYYNKDYKTASKHLSALLNDVSFKNHLHADVEIKLFLILNYSLENKYDLAWNLLRSVTRKLKEVNKIGEYENGVAFTNMLKAQNNQPGGLNKKISKQASNFKLLNQCPNKMLSYIKLDDTFIELLSRPMK
ncbi:MAG: hypothetical protein JKY52_10105 [Flavobacteriales bacterium]|nr:hypothetical protein [Flavobacteriales bacterium]